MKKVIISIDSFKDTITSIEACNTIKEEGEKIFKDTSFITIPIADGGEGSLDVFKNDDYEYIKEKYTDLNFDIVESLYLLNRKDKKAIIEIAKLAGLPQSKSKNPRYTTTYGVGEQIKSAIDNGAKDIIICLGGSGTNDAGTGLMSALGVKYYDLKGNNFIPVGNTLKDICSIDLSGLDERLKNVNIIAMCDVTNPPVGENGAANIYASQKGANEDDIIYLEEGMKNYLKVLNDLYHNDFSNLEGGGAAGGIGLSLCAMLNAKLERGINIAIKESKFIDHLKDADLVITGEGKLDNQSFMGKVIDGISSISKKNNVSVIVVCGKNDLESLDKLKEYGITKVYQTLKDEKTFEEIKLNAKANLRDCARDIFNDLKNI